MSTTTSSPWAPCYAGIRQHLAEMKIGGRGMVYLALLTRLNTVTGQLNPSIKTLATDCCLYDDTVTEAIKWLIERGLVQKTGRRFASNSYALPVIYIDGSIDGHGTGFQPGRETTGTAETLCAVPCSDRDVVPVSDRDKVESMEEETNEVQSTMAASPPAGSAGDPLGIALITTSEGKITKSPPAEASHQPKVNRFRKAGMGNAKPAGLTDEQKVLACGSASAMGAYLCHGAGALGKAKDEFGHLPKSSMHWSPTTGDLTRPEAGASIPALAGFFWWRVSRAREVAGQPVTLANHSRLLGTIKTLRKTMTEDALINLIVGLTKNWASITSALCWMTVPPALDELVLQNRHVVDLAGKLATGQTLEVKATSPRGDAVDRYGKPLDKDVVDYLNSLGKVRL